MRDRFRAAGLDTPELDARLLAQRAFGFDAMALVRRERELPSDTGKADLLAYAERRLAGEPVSRIVGEKPFWGHSFLIDPSTLVPRPETEILVGEAVEFIETRFAPRCLDLGTGSGAIAVSILDAVSTASGLATDISAEALDLARRNAEKFGVANRLDLKQGSWWEAVPEREMFDVIVSNPPYIATEAIEALAPEVRLHDPRAALDGGWDGLDAYRAIVVEARRRLLPKGMLLVEIGATQGEAVKRLIERAGLAEASVLQDLQGLDRVVKATHS